MALEGGIQRGVVRLEWEETGSRTLYPSGDSFTTYPTKFHFLQQTLIEFHAGHWRCKEE